MKIYILPFGTLTLPQSLLYGDDFPSDQMGTSPMYGVLIDHPEGRILYDTGLLLDDGGLDMISRNSLNFSEDDLLVNRLKSIGFTADDINYVVISHLHCDHCGNLHKFPNAEVLVNKNDFEETLIKYGLGNHKLMPPGYIQKWVEIKPRWKLVDDPVTELVPGVKIFTFGRGHTFGMLMLRVETAKNGIIYMVQDLIYSKELFGKHKLPGIVLDGEGYYAAVERIKAMSAEDRAAVWFGHDIEQVTDLMKVPNGYYE
jgi:glyoxylase-like metal-dependent hydrolase (beta-lactamase superfamily II)